MPQSTDMLWWKVIATPLYDDVPNDDGAQTFYALCARETTAVAEVKDAMLDAAFARDEYGPHDVRIDEVTSTPLPPQGALYQMLATSKL